MILEFPFGFDRGACGVCSATTTEILHSRFMGLIHEGTTKKA